MALKGTLITRVFKYNGMTLNDPMAAKTAEGVRLFYATMYPELLNAVTEGPVTKNGVSTYTFTRAAGEKGASHLKAITAIAAGKQSSTSAMLVDLSIKQIQEIKTCSTVLGSVVNSCRKSTPLQAPASAYSRFG